NCSDIRSQVLSGQAGLSRQTIKQLAALDATEQPDAVRKALQQQKAPRPKRRATSGLDRLDAAWAKATTAGKRSFLRKVLSDAAVVALLKGLGWDLKKAPPSAGSDEEAPEDDREEEGPDKSDEE